MSVEAFLGVRVFMGSVTNVANTPFRRWVTAWGARATLGEMALAQRIAKGGRQDRLLLRHHPEERCFGAQIVGARDGDLVQAAQAAREAGARFIDLNCACPHRSVTDRGGGAALARRPVRVGRAVGAMVAALAGSESVPVTVKLRSGWDRDHINAVEAARAAVDNGAAAIFVHGRTREERYRGQADWDLVAQVAASLPVPVIGCGDVAHGPDVAARLSGGCAGVAIARGALIKPWIFREIEQGCVLDPSGEERLEALRELVRLSLEHFGQDGLGLTRAHHFLHLQMDFLTRYVPVGALGRELGMQERVNEWQARDELEALWAGRERAQWAALLSMAALPPLAESQDA